MEAPEVIVHITYYMNIIDALLTNFDKEIGDWCIENGIDVKAVPVLLKRARDELVGVDNPVKIV